MTQKEILVLLDRYLAGETSFEEEQLLSRFHETYGKGKELDEAFFTDERRLAILSKIENQIHFQKSRFINWKRWLPVAAAVIIMLSITGILYFNQKFENISQVEFSQQAEQIMPGTNKAILRLADGTIISLDDRNSSNRTLLKEKGLTVKSNNDGQLLYIIADTKAKGLKGTNSIETPRGGKYEVLLPDGTHVWLNAASALTYNLDFSHQRKVKLQGEAYFEVAKKKVPFTVQHGMQEIQVLGTHFNVNAYQDESYSETTLLEGQIALRSLQGKDEKTILMRPNFKVTTDHHSGLSKQSIADIESVMAWKNGDFLFEDQELASILRVIARWYDVKVDYNSLPKTRYTLQLSKQVRLSDVLKMLEKTGSVKFQFEQNTIKVEK
ncbi:FecR family protein [Sphingobacterium kitahiroshimense]|uniref:FecR domain-containing protein n=1 Tax=Sphingobacterium kitahiroshimense TaxID=470446 RepID=A0ABV0BSM7_9SPHI